MRHPEAGADDRRNRQGDIGRDGAGLVVERERRIGDMDDPLHRPRPAVQPQRLQAVGGNARDIDADPLQRLAQVQPVDLDDAVVAGVGLVALEADLPVQAKVAGKNGPGFPEMKGLILERKGDDEIADDVAAVAHGAGFDRQLQAQRRRRCSRYGARDPGRRNQQGPIAQALEPAIGVEAGRGQATVHDNGVLGGNLKIAPDPLALGREGERIDRQMTAVEQDVAGGLDPLQNGLVDP